VKIAFVNPVNSNSHQIAALKTQFDLDCLQADEVVSDYDLVVYDACLNEALNYSKTTPLWMVINETSIGQTLEYFRAGASGVLGPDYSLDSFKQCIETIHSGKLYLAPDIVQVLAIRQIRKLLEPFAALSSREFDIFCLLAEGCSVTYIAGSLGVSSKTVFNCQTQIRNKLKLKNSDQIKAIAESHGLIQTGTV
jgi:DNA-binding NarL/FixJ family response regulator